MLEPGRRSWLAALVSLIGACTQAPADPATGKGPADSAKSSPASPSAVPESPDVGDPEETPEAAPSEPELAIQDPIPAPPEGPHPFGARDLVALDRLGEHVVSPDGSTVVFVRRSLNHATGKRPANLWSIPVGGGEPRSLTDGEASDSSPRFAPDGTQLYFLSSRSGSTQVWRMALDGSDPTQVTDLPLPVGNLQVSPDGKRIAFTADVFVDCDDLACTKDRLDAAQRDPSTGHGYDQLFVRHWDTWKDGRRSHLWTMALPDGEPVDVTQGLDADVPSRPFGGPEEYTFSPDGTTIVYTARNVGREEAWSTNFDLYSIAADGSGEASNLTADNPAWDTQPVFSPDGKTLVWAAMARPGFEADRFRIKARTWPEGPVRTVTEAWDRSAGSMTFAPDGQSLLVTAQHLGQVALFRVALADGEVTELLGEGSISGPMTAGERIVLSRNDLLRPADLWTMPASGGEATMLTELNAERLAQVSMGKPEQWTFAGDGGETVHAYTVQPAGYREGERYPLAFLIHGGPQGSFGNKFHYRWNPQTYAGAGHAVVMVDFHGSTGYGQDFTDSISGDWGGKPLVDLQKGLAAALERDAWIDGDRACALGASYGGYMINWIAGNWPDRFRCLVNHDGVFDLRAMYYSTEELWFPEWEQGGPHYEGPQDYERHNPVRFVDRWKTPMLVIQGALDYRVPETQGLGAFTALQRRGVPSRYLNFPDENHWVLSTANSLQWHDEVERWLHRWLSEPTPG
ncbi:MAG: S9 family peptidase [Nannocystaceae bacterium]